MRLPGAATLRGIEAACEVALAAFEAAPDGSGDVSKADARRIRIALTWTRAVLAAQPKKT